MALINICFRIASLSQHSAIIIEHYYYNCAIEPVSFSDIYMKPE